MAILHLLVKDFGREGFTVHGVTDRDDVAQAWETADGCARRIVLDTEASLSLEPLPFSELL